MLAKEVAHGVALHYLGRKADSTKWIDQLISRVEKAHAEAAATDEQLGAAYQIKAVFLWQTQQYEALELFARHMLTRFPNAKAADVMCALLGGLYAGRGELAEYEPLARQRLKLNPGNIIAQNDLAETLAEQGKDLNNALLLARNCVRQEPDNIAYLDTLAWTLFKLGRYEEALTYHQRACKGDSPEALALMRMGDCLLKLGRKEEARQSWQRGRARLDAKPCPNVFDAKVLADLRRRLAAEGVE
jgi:tetratricopeptide (TPR) repeat protein